MLISDKHKFAFVHIPKSAGTTVRFALAELDERSERYFDQSRREHGGLGMLDFAHLPLALVKQLYPDDFALLADYRSFALIRDPMARFSSSLHEYLHWNTDEKLAEVSPQRREEFVAQVIEKLSSLGDSEPVTDPALIHFSRQSDYVELDGERIVTSVYPVKGIGAMMEEISAITGTALDHSPRNQRMSYRFGALQSVSEGVQKGLKMILPRAVWKPIFLFAHSALTRTGIIRIEKPKPFSDLFGKDVESFVRKFYARDFALLEEVSPKAA